jgi:hypothetical protein
VRGRRFPATRLGWVALLAVVLYSCARVPVQTRSSTSSGALDGVALFRDGNDQYLVDSAPNRVTVSAQPTNTGGNQRIAFYPHDGPNVTDEVSCATWTAETTPVAQEGVALRVASHAPFQVRAITLTKNVYFGATWIFNFHLWNTANGEPFTQIGSVDLHDVLAPGGHVVPFPWRVCSRAVGSFVQFKVWPTSEPEPQWGDPSHGGVVLVSSEWVYPGRAGWYTGHLPPGASVTFNDLDTWAYVGAVP